MNNTKKFTEEDFKKHLERGKTLPKIAFEKFNLTKSLKCDVNQYGICGFSVYPHMFYEYDKETDKQHLRNGFVVAIFSSKNNPNLMAGGYSVCSSKDVFSVYKGCMLALKNLLDAQYYLQEKKDKEIRKFISSEIAKSLIEKGVKV